MDNSSTSRVITFLNWRRPQYTQEVVDGLRRCNNIEQYTIVATLDGNYDPNVLDILEQIDFCDVHIHQLPSAQGCNKATLFAILAGLKHADYIIHLEDDTVPGVDALEFFEAMNRLYVEHPTVMTVGGYTRNLKYTPGMFAAYFVRNYYHGWGVGYWRDKFNKYILPNWVNTQGDGYSWDTHYYENIAKVKGYTQVAPWLSRIQNVGALNGVHVPNAEWHTAHHYTPIWVDAKLDGISNLMGSNSTIYECKRDRGVLEEWNEAKIEDTLPQGV